MLRIALAQINTTVGDLPGNQQKILSFIERAKTFRSDIVVFPELTTTGYPPEDLLFKDHFVQDNIKVLRTVAAQVSDIAAVVGFVDRDQNKNLYNAAAVITGKKIKGVYHKNDLPNYGVFDEKRYFSEGQNGLLFSYAGILIGVNICEDIWIEGGVHAQQAKAGANLLINLSASPYDFRKLEFRKQLLKKRAKQCSAFICYTNLVGGQDELVFDGGSLIVNPGGKILALGKSFHEDLLIADLPIPVKPKRKVNSKNIVAIGSFSPPEKPPLPEHKVREPSQIESIYQALVLGTRDYMRKNGFKQAVVGLSGGIDSALVACLAVAAIGKENVIGISMPSQFTSHETLTDAQLMADHLGIRFMKIPIDKIYFAYLEELKMGFAGQSFNVAEENLQARIRGNILMAFSNKFDWLVLTTGNKSEIAVGYCTLYGDMSGGFAVIKDVPKTKVYEIAGLINAQSPGLIPETILKRAPTAELRHNQKDEDSLPPYADLDPLLKAYVEDHQSLAAMSKKGKDVKVIQDIIKMVDRSEYKRRQSPPGIKITPRAFGKDWRLPITNKYKEF